MKKLLITALAITTANFTSAEAQVTQATNKTTDMVVATVNENAITLQELKNRITLTKLLINRKLSSSEFQQLKSQAVEQLINEELKRQYSKDKKIVVSSKELNAGINFIEKQRGLEEGTLLSSIPESLKSSAVEQIKDSILQQKIIQKVIIPKVFVPDYEISNLLENVINQAETKEYKISKIMINSSNNQNNDMRKIKKIHQELIAGEKFENIVVAFSDGENKLEGGSLGWFSLNELNYKLKKEVAALSKGEFSSPVRSNEGWFIVKVDDIKVTKNIDTHKTVEYKFVLFKSPILSKEDTNNVVSLLNSVNGYSDFERIKKVLDETYNFSISDNLDWVSLEQIPEKHKNKVLNTLPSNFSEVVVNTDKSVKFIYLVDVRTKESEQVEKIRFRITTNLQKSKAERKFKKFAKDLRDKAFVEIR